MRIFKKWSSILLAALLCGAVLLTGCDSNKDPEQKSSEDVQQPTEDMPGDPNDKVDPVGLTYKVNDDGKTCAIGGIGSVTDADLVIPSKIDQYTVTSIADNAFKDCTNLTSVVIPDGVTGIGDWTFSGCTSLTSITIPDGLTGIGEWAFSGCTSLASITIPDSVTKIGIYAFQNCKSLKSITLSDNVTGIGDYAFRGCIGLTSITLGDSVTYIGWYAFEDCTDLTSITLPDSVTKIGWSAFRGCTDLTSITIPHSVTSIGNEAFLGCTTLKTVYYGGTAEDWASISIHSSNKPYLTSANIYYYSETKPTTEGNYWRYVDGVPTKW